MMKTIVLMIRALTLWLGIGLLMPMAGWTQETVCIQCHGGQEGRLGAPVGLWRGSIHAQNGISCHGCHGGDPTDFAMAMSPERGFIGVPAEEEIPGFCGRCHVGVKEDYLESAHGQALDAGGPTCVTCHGNHAVKKAGPDLINPEDCSRCHEYGRAEEIKAAVVETDQMIGALEATVQTLHRLGVTTKKLEDQIFSARNQFHRLFHSVDVDKIKRETAGVQRELGKVSDQIEEYHGEFATRKAWGGAVTVLLAITGLLFMLVRKSYHEEEEHGSR